MAEGLMGYKINKIEGVESLKQLKVDWQALTANCIDQSFYHCWAWYFGLNQSLINHVSYYCVYEREDLVAILPLVYEKKTRELSIPYCSQTDLSDFIVAKGLNIQRVLKVFFRALDEDFPGWSKLIMPAARLNSAAMALFKEHSGLKYDDCWTENYYFVLNEGCKTEVPKKQIKNSARLKKKLIKEFEDVEVIFNLDQMLDVESFLSIEDDSWKGQADSKTSILSEGEITSFYRCIATEFIKSNELKVNLIRVNGESAAGQFALLVNGRLSLLKISFRSEYERFGLGTILLGELLTSDVDSAHEVNMVTGPAWADRWHPVKESVHLLTFYNKNVLGIRSYLFEIFKEKLRPIKNRLLNLYRSDKGCKASV